VADDLEVHPGPSISIALTPTVKQNSNRSNKNDQPKYSGNEGVIEFSPTIIGQYVSRSNSEPE